MEDVRILSSKNIMQKSIKTFASDQVGEIVELYRLLGKCVRFSTKETDFGEAYCLHGQFKAIRLGDGHIFTSTKLYTLSEISDSVILRLSTSGVKSVEFAYSVGIVTNDNLQKSYEYLAVPLIDVKEADPLAALELSVKEAEASGKVKSLSSVKKPARKPAQKPAQKPAEKTGGKPNSDNKGSSVLGGGKPASSSGSKK